MVPHRRKLLQATEYLLTLSTLSFQAVVVVVVVVVCCCVTPTRRPTEKKNEEKKRERKKATSHGENATEKEAHARERDEPKTQLFCRRDTNGFGDVPTSVFGDSENVRGETRETRALGEEFDRGRSENHGTTHGVEIERLQIEQTERFYTSRRTFGRDAFRVALCHGTCEILENMQNAERTDVDVSNR